MENVIVVLILLAIATGIIWYLIRAKKNGQHCAGCPHSKSCGSNCSGGCNCHGDEEKSNRYSL